MTPTAEPHEPQSACATVSDHIAAGEHQIAWTKLQQLAQHFPQHAPIFRLRGGLLQQAGQPAVATVEFRQALALDANDSQSHYGLGRCLHTLGEIPQALRHFREALRCQCQQPRHASSPPTRPTFDTRAAEAVLWRTLAQLAAAGIQAFPTAGTLLGLVREGQLLAGDKDLDISLPFAQMDAAVACLEATGWRSKINIHGLVNPIELHGHGVALDLCGYLPDTQPGKVIGGFWFQSPDHPWSRITTVDVPELERRESPCGPVWQPIHPEAILLPLYGEGWRIPDPDFDTIIAACSLRGFSVLTQCYAFARIYNTWLLGQTRKTRTLVNHTLRHLPEDEWLLAAAQLLGKEDVRPAALITQA